MIPSDIDLTTYDFERCLSRIINLSLPQSQSGQSLEPHERNTSEIIDLTTDYSTCDFEECLSRIMDLSLPQPQSEQSAATSPVFFHNQECPKQLACPESNESEKIETGRKKRKCKIPGKFNPNDFDISEFLFSGTEGKQKSKKLCQNISIENHSNIDPVFLKKFGIETKVRYSNKVTIDPAYRKKAQAAWETYKNDYAVFAGESIQKEIQKYEECIAGSSPDGFDKWTDKYEVKWISKDVGYGLFAKSNYEKNEVIGFYSGVVTHLVENKEYSFDWFDSPFEGLSTDGANESNATRYINHASNKKANVTAIEHHSGGLPYIIFVAKSAIAAGKQFFYDYGAGYWEKKGIEPISL